MTHELTEAEMKEVLATQVLGHLACCEDHLPYVVPMALRLQGRSALRANR